MYQFKTLSRYERQIKEYIVINLTYEIMAYQKRKYKKIATKRVDSKLVADIFIELIAMIGVNILCTAIAYFAFSEGFHTLTIVMGITFVVSTIAHYKYIDEHLKRNM